MHIILATGKHSFQLMLMMLTARGRLKHSLRLMLMMLAARGGHSFHLMLMTLGVHGPVETELSADAHDAGRPWAGLNRGFG